MLEDVKVKISPNTENQCEGRKEGWRERYPGGWNQEVSWDSEEEHQNRAFKKFLFRDFPGSTVDKNLPANVGYTGSSPGPGRFHMPWGNKARMPQLLRLCPTAQTLQLLKPTHHN